MGDLLEKAGAKLSIKKRRKLAGLASFLLCSALVASFEQLLDTDMEGPVHIASNSANATAA